MNHRRFSTALLFLCTVAITANAQSLTWEPLGPASGVYGGLCIDSGGTIYAYKWQGGIVRSTDLGSTWQLVADYQLGSLVAGGRDTAYLVDDAGVLRRTIDAGRTWTQGSVGISTIAAGPDGWLYATRGRYVNVPTTVLRFTPRGTATKFERWTPTAMALVGTSGSGAVFGLGVDTLFRSDDRGEQWQPVMTGVGEMPAFFGSAPAGRLYFINDGSHVFRSSDDGVTWLKTGEIPDRTGIVMGTAIGDDGSIFIGQGDRKLMRSTDEGATWYSVSEATVTTLIRVPGGLLGSSLTNRMSRSTDYGETWTTSNAGLPGEPIPVVLATSDTAAVAWLAWQVRLTMHEGDSIRWLARARTASADFHRSSDGRVFMFDDNTRRVYRTTDQGATWDSSSVADTNFTVRLVVDREGRLVGAHRGLYRSTDFGDSWSTLDSSADVYTKAVAVDSSGRIIAARGRGLAWFDEATRRWVPFDGFPELRYGAKRLAVMPDGTLLALASGEAMYRSVDAGVTWTTLARSECVDLAVSHGGLLVVAEGDRILASRDRGTTFFEIGQDLWFGAYSLSFSPSGRLFAGTPFGLFRSRESLLSAPREGRPGAPGSLSLHPNPARDAIEVSYMLPHRTPVRITVVDARGREVLRAVGEMREDGAGRKMLDVGALAAGAYIVRLDAGDISIARALIKR